MCRRKNLGETIGNEMIQKDHFRLNCTLWCTHIISIYLVVVLLVESDGKKLGVGQTQFMGSKFGNFGEFGWVRNSILINEPGFGRV